MLVKLKLVSRTYNWISNLITTSHRTEVLSILPTLVVIKNTLFVSMMSLAFELFDVFLHILSTDYTFRIGFLYNSWDLLDFINMNGLKRVEFL